MPLTDFFSINLPYGIHRDADNVWYAFNREYAPIGWNYAGPLVADIKPIADYIHTEYKELTEDALLKIAGSEDLITRNENGSICRVYLYGDRTNPNDSPQYWDDYFHKIKLLSHLKVK